MDFALSDRVRELQRRTHDFMHDHVWPANAQWCHMASEGDYPLAVIDDLKPKARAQGLWNLFLPGLRDDEPGTRLSNLEYAPLAEIMGRLPWASEVFNCNAPDTGNMELLHLFATPEQRERWLKPLLEGQIRSCFAMTEPDAASSDPTNLCATIRREGDELVVNGRKWFITGALHPNCTLCIVMAVSDPDAAPHARHAMVLVPMDAPGVRIVRDLPIMNRHSPEGHCEMLFRNVRLPASALLGESGRGFALAQARLGPGRVHHAMRTIGQCELALELMCERALSRRAFGKAISDNANIQDWIAHARLRIDQARLLVLRAAWLMDAQGNAAARIDVSAIKYVTSELHTFVLDRAMQVFGGMGLTADTPLADSWTWGRALHFLDGPDEVHLRTVARHELKLAKGRTGQTAVYYNSPGKI
jgi:acyl-CoA dehydrogenase